MKMHSTLGIAAVALSHMSTQAATVWSFDNFNNKPTSVNNGTLSSSSDTEAATAWKNVQGLTNLNGTFTATTGSHNWWDRNGVGAGPAGATGTTAIRIRQAVGQITTDNAMQLDTLGATTVTMAWDYLPDTDNYTVGLYYAKGADTVANPLVLLGTYAGGAPSLTWQSTSVTITDGVSGIEFTNDARFVLKYFSGSGGNGIDQMFDNIGITYTVVPEPGAVLLGGLGMLALLRRRR